MLPLHQEGLVRQDFLFYRTVPVIQDFQSFQVHQGLQTSPRLLWLPPDLFCQVVQEVPLHHGDQEHQGYQEDRLFQDFLRGQLLP